MCIRPPVNVFGSDMRLICTTKEAMAPNEKRMESRGILATIAELLERKEDSLGKRKLFGLLPEEESSKDKNKFLVFSDSNGDFSAIIGVLEVNLYCN